jgi:crossover junction endodeoxyribonuclease RusA
VTQPAPVYKLALPWPPSANRYWRSIVIPGQKHAQYYVGDAGKAYRKACAELAMVYRWPRALAGPIQLSVIAFPPDRRERDLDNLWKALLDVLKCPSKPKDVRAGVFVDDHQVKDKRIRAGQVVKNGLLHMVLRELPDGTEAAAGTWPVLDDGPSAAQPGVQVRLLPAQEHEHRFLAMPGLRFEYCSCGAKREMTSVEAVAIGDVRGRTVAL